MAKDKAVEAPTERESDIRRLSRELERVSTGTNVVQLRALVSDLLTDMSFARATVFLEQLKRLRDACDVAVQCVTEERARKT